MSGAAPARDGRAMPTTALPLRPGTVTTCPVCPRPARVLEAFPLMSTGGHVDHVKVSCPAGHWFTLPAERLMPLRLPGRRRRRPQG